MTHGYYRPAADTGVVRQWSRRKWWTLMLAGPFAWLIPAIVVVAVVGTLGGFFYVAPVVETWGGGWEIMWPLPVPWVIAPFFTLALVMAVNRFFRSRRRQRGRVVLGYLENALRLNLPLPEFLLAAQVSEKGRTAREIGALRERLMAGQTVAAAVHESVSGVSQEVIAQISAGEANGTLQPTFSRMEEEEMQRFQNDLGGGGEEERGLFLRFYLPCVVLTLLLLGLAWMVFIMPKFREIFKDFRTELPHVTERVLAISSFIGDNLPDDPVWMLLLAVPVFVLIGGQLQRMFVPAWPVPSFRWLYEFITWHTPFWRKIEMDRETAGMCRVLAEGVRAGKTLPDAMTLTLALPRNRFFRKRLLKWRMLVVGGRRASEAAAAAGMPALLVGFLAAGEDGRAGSNAGMAEMLEFVGRYYRGRVEHMALVLRAVAEPASVLLLGLGVGTCVYAVIVPLKYLIDGVMGEPPGGAL